MTGGDKPFRTPRQVPEREIALALVLELARSELPSFSLSSFYEDDEDFLHALAMSLGVEANQAFINKVTKVTRQLVKYDVLIAEHASNDRWYAGQPASQKEYRLRPGKATLLTQKASDCTMGPEGEAAFLIRRAYPNPEFDE